MSTEKDFSEIDELVLAFLRESITAEELDRLKAWLANDKNNKDYFRKMYMIWKVHSLSYQDKDKVAQAFQKVYSKTFEMNNMETLFKENKKGYSHIPLIRWAAVVFLSLCTGAVLSYIYYQSHSNKAEMLSRNEIIVPFGSKSRIVLPDRTEVWLNAGSKLTYSMSYGKKIREVNLEGEGYFKVARMEDKPFVVHALNANIKALGTEFNVKAYPDESSVETILVEGSVVVDKITARKSLGALGNEKSIVLKPGQKVLIYKNDLTEDDKAFSTVHKEVRQVEKGLTTSGVMEKEMNPLLSDTEVETSWKDPNWVIQGEKANEVFTMLRRRFNVSIILLDEELNKYKFSGIIENETLEQVFDLMSLTIPMSYSIEKGKVEVVLNRNLEKKYKRAYKD